MCTERDSGAPLKTASGAPQTGPPSPQGLHAAGFEIISTGGTAASIEKAGIPVKKVNAVYRQGRQLLRFVYIYDQFVELWSLTVIRWRM